MRIRQSIDVPQLEKPQDVVKAFTQLARAVKLRDSELARAINMLDIEITSSAPTAEPDFGAPAIKLYENGATFRVYFYFGSSGWKYATLT